MSPEEVANWLRSAYQRLPVGGCHGCTDCASRCAGDIPMLAAEYETICQYLNAQGQLVPTKRGRRTGEMMAPCRFLNEEARLCIVYPVRPLICRLFGLVEWLPCPTGKQSAVLTDGVELMRCYAELGPCAFSYWHRRSKCPR